MQELAKTGYPKGILKTFRLAIPELVANNFPQLISVEVNHSLSGSTQLFGKGARGSRLPCPRNSSNPNY